MCGIWGYISFRKLKKRSDQKSDQAGDICKLFNAFNTVSVRGPDKSDFKQINEFVDIFLGFHRLAIMDRSTNGDQPFTLEVESKSIYAICNGEIYNYEDIAHQFGFYGKLKSRSDCEILTHLYSRLGFQEMISRLRGEFAICIVEIDHETRQIQLYLGRDQTAVRPIFVGIDENGVVFSSILKGTIGLVDPTKIRQIARAEIFHVSLRKDSDLPPISSELYW
jgi:asparagine synthase (glutamine-hydrolysing)